MTSVSELQEAILGLSNANYSKLRRWLLERDFDEDVRAGKFDDLAAEVWKPKQEATWITRNCTGQSLTSGGDSNSCPSQSSK